MSNQSAGRKAPQDHKKKQGTSSRERFTALNTSAAEAQLEDWSYPFENHLGEKGELPIMYAIMNESVESFLALTPQPNGDLFADARQLLFVVARSTAIDRSTQTALLRMRTEDAVDLIGKWYAASVESLSDEVKKVRAPLA